MQPRNRFTTVYLVLAGALFLGVMFLQGYIWPPPKPPQKATGPEVYGFYAGNDARVGATVPPTQQLMKAAGKTFEPVTYEGAGHGFMRAGDAPPPPATADQKTRDAYAGNKKARDDAWARWKKLLGR